MISKIEGILMEIVESLLDLEEDEFLVVQVDLGSYWTILLISESHIFLAWVWLPINFVNFTIIWMDHKGISKSFHWSKMSKFDTLLAHILSLEQESINLKALYKMISRVIAINNNVIKSKRSK